MQMLTALHLAAALLAAPSSGQALFFLQCSCSCKKITCRAPGIAQPFKAVASGRYTGFLPAMPDDEEEAQRARVTLLSHARSKRVAVLAHQKCRLKRFTAATECCKLS